MSADYDLYSGTIHVVGTEEGVLLDGTNYTPAILMGDWKSAIFAAQLNNSGGAEYADIAWTVQDSANGSTWAAADSAVVIRNNPVVLTTLSRVFHVGYIGKKDYVRAAFAVNGGVSAAALDIVTQPTVTLTSLTSSSTTATATLVAHGFKTGQKVSITGASPVAYNVTNATLTRLDADTFSYTFAGGTSPATGTIKASVTGGWTATGASLGADRISVASVGANALTGAYIVSTLAISASAHNIVAKSATGNGVVTIASPVAAVLAPYVNQTFRAKCTAVATDAGTFTVYMPDGVTALSPTVTVGAGAATILISAAAAFNLTIADGSSDWILGDTIDITFDDLGKNIYKLTAPNGSVVGYPVGGTAFSTGAHLTFTIPDTSVAVSSLAATASITVVEGLAYGHISVIKGNPLSGPLNSASITDKAQTLNS